MISRRLQILLVVLVVAAFGLGYFALRLKRQAEAVRSLGFDTRPIEPPAAGKSEPATLYVADDRDGSIRERQLSLALPDSPPSRALALLRALSSAYRETSSTHQLGQGADIRSVYFVTDNLAVIDTNAEFADRHRAGALVEELTVVSFIETLTQAFPKLTQVKILVDGRERETLAGHVDLKNVFDVNSIHQLAREFK